MKVIFWGLVIVALCYGAYSGMMAAWSWIAVNNAVDEIKDLPNPDDATLARLWEWVIVPAEGEPKKGDTAACDQKIGTGRLACTCERGVIGAMQTEQARCPFAWQRGPATWTKNGDVVWRTEVVESFVKAP